MVLEERLTETTLPKRQDSFDTLRQEVIILDEYERVRKMWDIFNCETLGDYSDYYSKTDVLLPTDFLKTSKLLFPNFKSSTNLFPIWLVRLWVGKFPIIFPCIISLSSSALKFLKKILMCLIIIFYKQRNKNSHMKKVVSRVLSRCLKCL